MAPATAYADVNDFTVTNFAVDYYLNNADPQGELRVVERINVAFSDQNHGLLRAIPRHYKGLPLDITINKVSSSTGAPAGYATSNDGSDNEVLKIGDPNQTVTGAQEYTIDYTLRNVIGFYKGHDELYWDVNGTEWRQPFAHIVARLHLPSGLKFTDKSLCFAGGSGSQDQDCTITQTGQELTTSTDDLGPGQTLTFVAAFPRGYFRAPTTADYVQEYITTALQVAVPASILGGIGFVWWLRRGRDAKGTGIIVPQYDAPDGLSPLEVGTVYDFRVDNRDLTATIIDLAVRRYLNIVEADKKLLMVTTQKHYELHVANRDWSRLNDWERSFMETFFGLRGQTDIYDLSKRASAADRRVLVQVFKLIAKQVEQSLTSRGYFASNPTKYLSVSIVAIAVMIIVFVQIVGSAVLNPVTWGIIIGAVIFVFFFHALSARTSKGTAALEHIKGLKLYMEVAEKDRLARLQSPDSRDLMKTSAPEPTVELFEKLLPYAVALQVEKKWAKKFASIYTSPPDWYIGNNTAFNVGYLAGSLGGGLSSAVGANFGASMNASGSGFGGGFAGGGGGGGGGGGW